MKQTYYFKHDQDARYDPKTKMLIEDYGIEGYGKYWIVLEMFRATTGYKLENKDYVWSALALELRTPVPEVKKFIKDCVEKYELFQNGDGYFYSLSFIERMQKLDDLRAKRKRAADIRWGNEDDI